MFVISRYVSEDGTPIKKEAPGRAGYQFFKGRYIYYFRSIKSPVLQVFSTACITAKKVEISTFYDIIYTGNIHIIHTHILYI